MFPPAAAGHSVAGADVAWPPWLRNLSVKLSSLALPFAPSASSEVSCGGESVCDGAETGSSGAANRCVTARNPAASGVETGRAQQGPKQILTEQGGDACLGRGTATGEEGCASAAEADAACPDAVPPVAAPPVAAPPDAVPPDAARSDAGGEVVAADGEAEGRARARGDVDWELDPEGELIAGCLVGLAIAAADRNGAPAVPPVPGMGRCPLIPTFRHLPAPNLHRLHPFAPAAGFPSKLGGGAPLVGRVRRGGAAGG